MNDNKAFAIFVIAACSAGAIATSVPTFVDGNIKQKEIELKIEKEKTKQLQYERADTTAWNN